MSALIGSAVVSILVALVSWVVFYATLVRRSKANESRAHRHQSTSQTCGQAP